LEHPPGVVFVGRLAQDLSLTFGHRVAAENQAAPDVPGDVGRLLKGKACDQFGRAFAGAQAALG
jgi:hypothetical protein